MTYLTLSDPTNPTLLLATFDMSRAEELTLHLLGTNLRELFPSGEGATTTWNPQAIALALKALCTTEIDHLFTLPLSQEMLPPAESIQQKPASEATSEELAQTTWSQAFTQDDTAYIRFSFAPLESPSERQRELNTGKTLELAAELQTQLMALDGFVQEALLHPGAPLTVNAFAPEKPADPVAPESVPEEVPSPAIPEDAPVDPAPAQTPEETAQ